MTHSIYKCLSSHISPPTKQQAIEDKSTFSMNAGNAAKTIEAPKTQRIDDRVSWPSGTEQLELKHDDAKTSSCA